MEKQTYWDSSPNNFDETGKPAGIDIKQPRPQPAQSAQAQDWQNYGKYTGTPNGCPGIKSEPATVTDTGCTVLPAFPPWGSQQEVKVASGEPSLPAEDLVPDTMAGIWKLLGYRKESLYDFGMHTLSPAGKKPSLEASIRTYKKNMLLTVARALLLREYGKDFSAEQVKKSAVASWKNNGRMKKYSDVLKENLGGPVEKLILEILGEVQVYMEGKVDSKAKYLEKYCGEKWSIKSFVLMCKVTGQVDLKKAGWRTPKEK